MRRGHDDLKPSTVLKMNVRILCLNSLLLPPYVRPLTTRYKLYFVKHDFSPFLFDDFTGRRSEGRGGPSTRDPSLFVRHAYDFTAISVVFRTICFVQWPSTLTRKHFDVLTFTWSLCFCLFIVFEGIFDTSLSFFLTPYHPFFDLNLGLTGSTLRTATMSEM